MELPSVLVGAEGRARMLAAFFTTKRAGEGMRLGSSVVYDIVRAQSRDTQVRSAAEHSTAFKVYLPNVGASRPQSAVGAAEAARQGTETLLVVEDEPGVLQIMEAMLENLGYTVLTATNGEQAIEAYLAHRDAIALVLTDLVMPKMDGVVLCDCLYRINPNVKALVISGSVQGDPAEALASTGIVGFIQKPFSRDCLARAIREALDAQAT